MCGSLAAGVHSVIGNVAACSVFAGLQSIGATGVSQHVMAAMQLSNMAGEMQISNATVGAVFNMGGAAVANYLSVLEST